MRARLSTLAGITATLALFISPLGSNAAAQTAQAPTQRSNKYFTAETIPLWNGTNLEKYTISGPPKPPPGYELERAAVALPESDQAMATKTLTVPAFSWIFGCSAVSGAMIAGYYDRTGYPDMYTGSTNGGVMPLDSSPWSNWTDGNGDTYRQNPLIASHDGLDNRTTPGSLDDYWVYYLSGAQDPYITNGWTQHTWGDAIGDYMKTSQSANNNDDGSTSFYGYKSASPLTCSEMEAYSYVYTTDGTYGRKLFYEARGYTVTSCYNQPTDNQYSGGFSFAQFKAEIDANRPVLLNLAGHSIVGVGYNDSSKTVYIHDTWDYNTHTMTWGGSYSGMVLQSVSIVNITPLCSDNDGDGYGENCAAGPDCDDNNPAVHPGAAEVCNGIDDNCDGKIDENVKTTFYRDADGDGKGTANTTIQACTVPEGFVTNSTDCDDTDSFYTDICPDSEAKIIPGVLGWFLGDKEKTRSLLVIGPKGTVFDANTEVRWESGDIAVVSKNVFFNRFMFMKVRIDGAALGRGSYRALIGTCSGQLTLVK